MSWKNMIVYGSVELHNPVFECVSLWIYLLTVVNERVAREIYTINARITRSAVYSEEFAL